MTYREYIGARYVPLFADPLEWDSTQTYEPLTVVYYQGNSYTSRQAVPTGIEITNTTYWAMTGNYNAQVEQYRAEVATFDGRITQNTSDISDETTARQNADATLREDVDDNTDAITAIMANNWVTSERIAQNAVLPSKLGKSVIFIGDSWGQGYSPDGNVTSWINIVKPSLQGLGTTVYDSSRGGIGLTTGTYTYLSQLRTLESTVTNKEAVTLIYIGGGWNDNSSNSADYKNGIAALMQYINANYPYANVVIDWFGSGNANLTSIFAHAYSNKVHEHACELGLREITGKKPILVNAIGTLMSESYYASDGYHPNQTGQHVVARHVHNMLFGLPDSNYQSMRNLVLTPVAATSSNSLKFYIPEFWTTAGNMTGNIVGGYLHGEYTFTTAQSANFNGNGSIFDALITGDVNVFRDMTYFDYTLSSVCQLLSTNSGVAGGGGYFNVPWLMHVITDSTENRFKAQFYSTMSNMPACSNYMNGNLKQFQAIPRI